LKNKNLINARKRKGLTQSELGKQVDVEKTTVSNWENYRSVPPMERAFKVARILEEDVDYLFFSQIENKS